jgi:branched-chain amino acid transport system substrate-binding protein
MIPGMFLAPSASRAPVALLGLLLVGCTLSVTPEPAPSRQASEASRQSTGPASDACAADPFGCVEVPAGDPILIGTALTLTGPNAALGLDSQYGAQVALNLRGEVAGHEVELVNHDDRCSSEGGTAAATLLVELQGLAAVIGTSCSSAAEPASDILGARGVMLLSPSNTAPRLTADRGRRPFYARVAPNDAAHGRAVAEFACTELGVKTAATVQDGGGYAEAVEEAFASAFEADCNGQLTERATLGEGSGIASVLDTIATSNDGASPELLYHPLATDQGAALTRRARRTSGLGDTILASPQVGLDGTATPGLFDGTYVSAPILTPVGDFYEAVFLEEYRNVSATDEPIAAFHGQAFDAANLLLDAVEAVAIDEGGSLYIPRTALRDHVLATDGYGGMSGTFTCRSSGDCGAAPIAISLVDGGALERVWP